MSALARLGIESATSVESQSASANQTQTAQTFSFKWSKRDSYESPEMKRRARTWLLDRYCAGEVSRLDDWLAGQPKLILDAGCGSGFSALLLFGERLRAHDYLGVDISDAVEVARERFAEADIPGDFLQGDLTDLPIDDASVDFVFAEGVLHHTDDTGSSLSYLAQKLRRGGRFLFYVYARKSEIREFTDDFVRHRLAGLEDDEAWEALKPLTRLGIALGEVEGEIEVPEDVPVLGIKAGRHTIQRFFYWNVLKAFYRPELTLDEMNHINFDWFRPFNCHRHTPEEVVAFCRDARLDIEHMKVEPAGITVVATRI